MQHLGRIVLIGQHIEYLNRVRIIADKDGRQTNPGPVVNGSLDTVKSDEAKAPSIKRTIMGSNLQDAKIESDDPGVSIMGYLPRSDGSGVDFTFNTKDAPADVISHHRLRVKTQNGETPISVDVDLSTPPKPTTPPAPATPPAATTPAAATTPRAAITPPAAAATPSKPVTPPASHTQRKSTGST